MSQVVNLRLQDPKGEKRIALPTRLVAAIFFLSVLPTILNWLGVDFSAVRTPGDANAGEALLIQRLEILEQVSAGEFIHALLEWSAFCIALFTAIFAYTNYTMTRDVATPVIGTALFFSGMIDAFRTLAAARLIPTVVDLDHFIPFTWAISRTINAIFLIAGMLPFVWASRPGRVKRVDTGPRFIVLAAIMFGLMAYSIIHICAVLPQLPETVFPKSNFAYRPWDLIPLSMFLLAGASVFPRFHRLQPNLFSHAVMVSVIPSSAAQFHAAFGSTMLYDNHFNISLYLKVIANLVPMAGLILDYSRAYRNEVTLRLTEEKLRVARDVQQGLLPKHAPVVPGFDLAGISAPAEAVGGDYFDFLPMSDGSLGIIVADVSGHEIGGSILMAQTRAYLRALAQTRADVSGILTRLNRFLIEDVQNKWFVTLFFARLNAKENTFSYAAAGHAGYVCRADGTVETLAATSTPLGLIESERIQFAPDQSLAVGDILLMLTDGIVEARSPGGEYFGLDRVTEVVARRRDRSAEEIVNSIMAAVQNFSGRSVQLDDVTVVALRRMSTA